jgi:hypothetical protein
MNPFSYIWNKYDSALKQFIREDEFIAAFLLSYGGAMGFLPLAFIGLTYETMIGDVFSAIVVFIYFFTNLYAVYLGFTGKYKQDKEI